MPLCFHGRQILLAHPRGALNTANMARQSTDHRGRSATDSGWACTPISGGEAVHNPAEPNFFLLFNESPLNNFQPRPGSKLGGPERVRRSPGERGCPPGGPTPPSIPSLCLETQAPVSRASALTNEHISALSDGSNQPQPVRQAVAQRADLLDLAGTLLACTVGSL